MTSLKRLRIHRSGLPLMRRAWSWDVEFTNDDPDVDCWGIGGWCRTSLGAHVEARRAIRAELRS